MMRMSVPRSRRWVAKLWRSECTVTGFRVPAAGKQPALLRRHALVVARRALLPPLAQQTEHLGRQHDVAVLAPFGLHDTDDVLGAVDVADPEPDHLAGA